MPIFLIRHGETEWNIEGRLQGWMDSPLTERGRSQARSVGDLLASILSGQGDYRFLCSPLGRTRATALLILEQLGWSAEKLETENLLREVSFGDWSGFTWNEIENTFPGAVAARKAAHWTYRAPNGESYEDAAGRASAWIKQCDEEITTIAVTHEMMSRCIQKIYLGLDTGSVLKQKHPHQLIVELADAGRKQYSPGTVDC